MSVPVTICDDSQFARNQVFRALPSDWDIDIHFATNGQEALEAIEQGMAEVLFLDLTMPVLDGIDVLEKMSTLRHATKVIVISADIQPAIQERVNGLGALAFMHKPIDEHQLIQLLNRCGIYSGQASTRQIKEQRVERNDWVAELINVAMGNAADRLATTFGFEITLTVPHVSELEHSDVRMLLSASQGRSQQDLISQGFNGFGISGECLIFVETEDSHTLSKLFDDGLERADIYDVLFDLSGILNGSLLRRFFSQLDSRYYLSAPVALRHSEMMLEALGYGGLDPERFLAVEINYQIKTSNLNFSQIVVFTPNACTRFDTLLRAM